MAAYQEKDHYSDDDYEETEEHAHDPKDHHEEVANMLHDTFWCFYCCCFGKGCSHCTDPCCLGQSKCFCIESMCTTTDCCGDMGCCYALDKSLCCVTHSACPPGGGGNDGVPLCACCNIRCGGEHDDQPETNANAIIMGETFLCFYAGCYGQGCSHPADPLFKGSNKYLCIQQECGTVDCCDADRGWCFQYAKTCCIVEACSFPPGVSGKHDGLPMFACCGMKFCDDEEEEENQH